MNEVKELEVSDGTVVKVMPKKTNIGQAIMNSPDGKLIQFRSDFLPHRPACESMCEILRGVWTAMFGEDEAESLLNQFRKEYKIER